MQITWVTESGIEKGYRDGEATSWTRIVKANGGYVLCMLLSPPSKSYPDNGTFMEVFDTLKEAKDYAANHMPPVFVQKMMKGVEQKSGEQIIVGESPK